MKFKQLPQLPEFTEPSEKRKNPEEGSSFIDLTEPPLKKRMGKSSVDVDEFVDLTESPMKIPAHSDTEVGSVSQSEDERASCISAFAEPIDVTTSGEDTDVEETQESYTNKIMNST